MLCFLCEFKTERNRLQVEKSKKPTNFVDPHLKICFINVRFPIYNFCMNKRQLPNTTNCLLLVSDIFKMPFTLNDESI